MTFTIPTPLQQAHEAPHGEFNAEMSDVLALTDRLEAEFPAMLEVHKAIVAALQRLQQAAERAGCSDNVAFAHQLVQHARTEVDVMYPAAVLVGLHARLMLGQRADHRMST